MERDLLASDMEGLSTAVVVPRGSTLCREGALAREAMLIVDGEADVYRDGEIIGRVGAGDLIGEIGLENETHLRSATVVASSSCTVKVMSAREFSALRFKSAAFRELLAANLKKHS